MHHNVDVIYSPVQAEIEKVQKRREEKQAEKERMEEELVSRAAAAGCVLCCAVLCCALQHLFGLSSTQFVLWLLIPLSQGCAVCWCWGEGSAYRIHHRAFASHV
jgi:hypothetical protein